jgi:hypothetical protein
VCYLYVIVTIVNLLILIYIFGKCYVLFEYTFLLLRTFVTCRGLHFGGEFSTRPSIADFDTVHVKIWAYGYLQHLFRT